MTDRRLVNQYLRAFEKGDPGQLDGLLHADFELDHYALPRVVDKEAAMALAEALATALPDGRYEPTGIRPAEDGTLTGTVRFTGTHSGTLDLRCVGLPPLPATGKRIEGSQERGTWVPADGQVKRYKAERPADGGLLRMLQAGNPFSLFDRH